METIKALHTRRSIRKFTGKEIPAEKLDIIMRAAMAAPSAGNAQPWHFVVIDDRKILDTIPSIHQYAGMCKTAGCAVLVCADLSLEKYPGYWVQDCSAATQNILLAAHDIGLGAVWCGIHPDEQRERDFAAMFTLPENVRPVSLVVMGISEQEAKAVDRYDASRLHKNEW